MLFVCSSWVARTSSWHWHLDPADSGRLTHSGEQLVGLLRDIAIMLGPYQQLHTRVSALLIEQLEEIGLRPRDSHTSTSRVWGIWLANSTRVR